MTTRYLNMSGMIFNGEEHGRTVFIKFSKASQVILAYVPQTIQQTTFINKSQNFTLVTDQKISQKQSEVCQCDMIERQYKLII